MLCIRVQSIYPSLHRLSKNCRLCPKSGTLPVDTRRRPDLCRGRAKSACGAWSRIVSHRGSHGNIRARCQNPSFGRYLSPPRDTLCQGLSVLDSHPALARHKQIKCQAIYRMGEGWVLAFARARNRAKPRRGGGTPLMQEPCHPRGVALREILLKTPLVNVTQKLTQGLTHLTQNDTPSNRFGKFIQKIRG